MVRDVFEHGEDMRLRKLEIARESGVPGDLFRAEFLKGPYAPLRRFGNYITVLKSRKLMDMEAEQRREPRAERARAIDAMKSDADHYVVSFFDTMGAAEEFADQNRGSKYPFAEPSEKAPRTLDSDTAQAQVLEMAMERVGADSELAAADPRVRDRFRELLRDLYFDNMDERSARLSLATRKNRAGFERNMMRSFLTHARVEAALIANMENGRNVNRAFVEMSEQASQDRRRLQPAFNMAARHYRDLLDPPVTPIQDRLAAVNSLWMLTSSIGYHVTNATQPVMVTVPRLAGDFGDYARAWDALLNGYRVARRVVSMPITRRFLGLPSNWQAEVDPALAGDRYRGMLEDLQRRGLLDVGMEEDLGEFDRSATGYGRVDRATDAFNGVIDRAFQAARYVEAINRVSAAVAAHDLASANPDATARIVPGDGSAESKAVDYATEIVQDTQGNFSRLDAPLLVKALPKLTVQYRKYQLMMGWAYWDAGRVAFKGADPHERAAGQRTLAYLLAHGAVFAGTAGVPALQTAAWMLSMMPWTDDEPYDTERWIRMNIDDGPLGDAISRGLPSLFGIDMSLKLNQANLFSVLPYAEWELSQEGVKSLVLSLALGPSGTTALNVGRAGEYLDRGEYARAIEYVVPKGLRSAMESMRYASRGVTSPSGDVMLDPRKIGVVDLLVNGLGLQASDVNKLKWRRGQQHELETWFGQRSSDIRRRYVDAGPDERRELEEEWDMLQDAKDNVRPFFHDAKHALRRQGRGDLRRAPRLQARREMRGQQKLGTDG